MLRWETINVILLTRMLSVCELKAANVFHLLLKSLMKTTRATEDKG